MSKRIGCDNTSVLAIDSEEGKLERKRIGVDRGGLSARVPGSHPGTCVLSNPQFLLNEFSGTRLSTTSQVFWENSRDWMEYEVKNISKAFAAVALRPPKARRLRPVTLRPVTLLLPLFGGRWCLPVSAIASDAQRRRSANTRETMKDTASRPALTTR